MMTSKQQWFLNKLLNELEAIGIDATHFTNYASNDFSTYKTTKYEAIQDIDFLLKVKELGLDQALDNKYKMA